MSRQKIRARSGREADVMRGRSAHALPGAIALASIASRTPARCLAMIVSANPGGANGSGVAVPKGTAGNRRGNAQAVVIARQTARFPRFPRFGRSQMRACAGAYAHVYAGGGKQGTREPLSFPSLNHRVVGSLTGSLLVPSGTANAAAAAARPVGRGRDILGGGNGAQRLALVADRRIRGQNDGRGGESFRVFGARLAPIGLELGRIQQRGGNGGNPPFSRASIGPVGRAMLEGSTQGVGLARFPAPCGQPVRLDRAHPASIGASAQAAPLCPHSRRRDPLAPGHATVSEFRSASREAFPALRHGLAGRAKVEIGQMGRGEGSLAQAPQGLTGRGKRRCSAWSLGGLALRRAGHASERSAGVN